MSARLGIVAGSGDLPRRLFEACRAGGRDPFILALEGHTDPALVEHVPHAWIRLGAAADGFAALRDAGVNEVVFIGPVRRPSLTSLMPDVRAAKFLARVGMRAFGDDGLLSAIVKEFEAEGFKVVGADEVLSELVAPNGVVGTVLPDDAAKADIARGLAVVKALGALDIGQGAVVEAGVVLGVEAIEGTDALIERAGKLKREGPRRGVLVKAKKPGQERRVDLPAVGVATVERVAAAGLAGIAIEAGAALIVDREEVARRADAAGIFVIGVGSGEPA
ncbi:MAG TPA: UDP-2,3-diacylglucosamine diphosphatase LpxI [Alphaproteobacteria bacterium]|nr:UDP-2,3-diacylglucosamine diphosphatase LpxI [Alphaproteobacteria bacterium]